MFDVLCLVQIPTSFRRLIERNRKRRNISARNRKHLVPRVTTFACVLFCMSCTVYQEEIRACKFFGAMRRTSAMLPFASLLFFLMLVTTQASAGEIFKCVAKDGGPL